MGKKKEIYQDVRYFHRAIQLSRYFLLCVILYSFVDVNSIFLWCVPMFKLCGDKAWSW